MAAALAVAVLASACKPQVPAAADARAASGDGPAPQPVPDHEDATPGTGAPGRAARHDAAAARALGEGRLYAPEGDSAIEHWLQARRLEPANPAIASAIAQLQPYLLIGCEQAIARHDFVEARRLHGLIAASDAGAPALQRLADAIATAELEAGRADAARLAAEEARRQQAAVAVVASPRPTALPAPAARAADDVPTRAAPSTASDTTAAPVATEAPATPRASPAAVADAPRLLHQPAPRYPSVALNRRLEGAVEVAFVIRRDGSVAETRVVSADPPGVFDRSALAAVSGYRFQPVADAVASRITVRFTLDR